MFSFVFFSQGARSLASLRSGDSFQLKISSCVAIQFFPCKSAQGHSVIVLLHALCATRCEKTFGPLRVRRSQSIYPTPEESVVFCVFGAGGI